MKKTMFILIFFLLIPMNIYANEATNISKKCIYLKNDNSVQKLNDDNTRTNIYLNSSDVLSFSCEENINYVYIIYEINSATGKITYNDENINVGTNGFLHELVRINSNNLNITYNSEVTISEIKLYNSGTLPSDVQDWQRKDTADLLLFSTHGDDEQLFFGGLIPTYINQGKVIHVAYLAKHDDMPYRYHEQLNGLWTIGVRNYPSFGIIPDAYSTSLEWAMQNMEKKGFTVDNIIDYQVGLIRQYKPKVIVGHDENGEYNHGQHILNTYALKQAVVKAEDETYVLDGTKAFKIQKVYLHLYDDANKTILDYDIPLEKFNNKTAYEVAKEGYLTHQSQQYTWFTKWLNGYNTPYTSAKEISKYNPAYYGLYYSSVGKDINKNDLFENVVYEKEKIVTRKIVFNKGKQKQKTNIEIPLLIFIGAILLMIILKKKKK